MRNKNARLCAVLMLLALLLGLCPQTVLAENILFITEIRLAAGEDGYDRLDAEGFSVMSIGLNAAASGDEQVWLGFRLGGESPVTDVKIIAGAGEGYDTEAGIHYVRASDVDVDQGRGTAGCVYYTTDERAGAPLVGLDILRADTEKGEELLAIPNDGSEVVRHPDGTPADLEPCSDAICMYLAQIRDGLVRPYISEIAPVTDTDRWNAVYTAAERGYDYFIDGDIDAASDTYTILACKRTADPALAITNIVAVSAEAVEALEAEQILAPVEPEPAEPAAETEEAPPAEPVEEAPPEAAEQPEEAPAEAVPEEIPEEAAPEEPPMKSPEPEEPVSASEALPEEPGEEFIEEPMEEPVEEPVEQPVEEPIEEPIEVPPAEPVEEPVGEPVEEAPAPEPEAPALTAEALDISGVEYVRISSEPVRGETPWYLYITRSPAAGNPISMLYAEADPESTQTLFGLWAYGYFSAKGVSRAASYVVNEDALAALQDDQTVCVKLPVPLLTGLSGETSGVLPLSMLTKKEGLPEGRVVLSGLRERTVEPPVVEHTERSDRDEKLTSTAFGGRGLALILGGALILAGLISALVIGRKRRSGTPETKRRGRQ